MRLRFARYLILTFSFFLAGRADEVAEVRARFLGAPSCGSSACHGGAGENHNQSLVWSRQDFHSRSYATLTTARSSRLAEELKLTNAVNSARCTICHAPIAGIPETVRLGGDPTDGVSCENCHGFAEPWIRSHTRIDLSHARRTELGMRDLRDIYGRASTCVACHQNLDEQLLGAGHPELLFELDGQAASQPRHWREKHSHGQLWLEGQAIALREMSWQLMNATNTEKTLPVRWSALLWVLQRAGEMDRSGSELAKIPLISSFQSASAAQKGSDELARRIAMEDWTPGDTVKTLKILSKTAAEFENKSVSREVQARRAERIVLALDRLTAGSSRNKTTDTTLDELFKLAQNLTEFNPSEFAGALKRLAANLDSDSSRH